MRAIKNGSYKHHQHKVTKEEGGIRDSPCPTRSLEASSRGPKAARSLRDKPLSIFPIGFSFEKSIFVNRNRKKK